MDALNTSFMRQFGACWGLLAGSLVVATPVVFFKIKEHVDIEEDLKFSDEIFAEVAPSSAMTMDEFQLADKHVSFTAGAV